MKIALVHDYLNEFGGAEVVLRSLADIFPEAPIYTAFAVPGSTAANAFTDRKVVTSWFGKLPFFHKLYSPLRFFIPQIWSSFNLKEFDVIISSASWYVTKGFDKKPGAIEICYCHTPPRWLYGFTTSVNLQKYLPVRIYAKIVGHYLRKYDIAQAQKVDYFVANSKTVAERINQFYHRDSIVVYPPVSIKKHEAATKGDYYLMVTRIVGGKGIDLAIEAAEKKGFRLVIAGEMKGYKNISFDDLKHVEYLGRVDEKKKYELMSGAKAFFGLSKDEDSGISVVESQAAGTPVVAFNGGGYRETVLDGKTGVLFDDYTVDGLVGAIKRFEKMEWNSKEIEKHAQQYGAERFKKEMLSLVATYAGTARN